MDDAWQLNGRMTKLLSDNPKEPVHIGAQVSPRRRGGTNTEMPVLSVLGQIWNHTVRGRPTPQSRARPHDSLQRGRNGALSSPVRHAPAYGGAI